MYNSTKNYVKRSIKSKIEYCIKDHMKQCGITVDDIKAILNEIAEECSGEL